MELKKDWEIKKLGELTLDKMSYGTSSPSCEYDGETRYIRITDINDNGSLNEDFVSPISYEEKHILQDGDIVFARTGATVGKAYCYHSSDEKYVYAGYLIRLRPNKKIVFPDYIYYYTKSYNYSEFIRTSQAAAAQPNVNAEKYSNLGIPVPPLEEQKRIVKILDEKFAQLETIKANAQTNLQNAKDLFQSQLTKDFNNTSWERKKISEISENLDSKRIPITKNVRKAGQYPYYGASGIVDYVEDYIFDGKFLLVSEDGANLLARTYPIAFIAEGKFWVNNHAHILSFKDETTMRFVELFFSNLDISSFVTGMAQPKFNQASLNNIEIPLPPLPEQKRIVEELDTLSEKVRQLQEIYSKQIANCADLKQSLLQKAFEGEL